MVLLWILQSALTTKLVLCDHNEIYTPSNQTYYYYYDDGPAYMWDNPAGLGMLIFCTLFGVVWLTFMCHGCSSLCKVLCGGSRNETFIHEREQVSKSTLKPN